MLLRKKYCLKNRKSRQKLSKNLRRRNNQLLEVKIRIILKVQIIKPNLNKNPLKNRIKITSRKLSKRIIKLNRQI